MKIPVRTVLTVASLMLTVAACGKKESAEQAQQFVRGAVQVDAAIWVEPWLFEGVSRDLAGMTVNNHQAGIFAFSVGGS